MFPFKTQRKTQSVPVVTYTLIILNVLVFLWQLSLPRAELREAFFALALVPCQTSSNLFSVETLLDSVRTMFFHGGWVHLIANMVALHLFGPHIEDYLGKARYLAFYLLAGFAAGMLHMVFNWNVCIPTIGASGAIYGLMGAFFLLYPATKIRMIIFLWRVPVGTISLAAFYVLLYYFALDFINGIASLGVENAATGGVAFWAHVGGFAAGVLMAFTAILFKPPPPVDALGSLDD